MLGEEFNEFMFGVFILMNIVQQLFKSYFQRMFNDMGHRIEFGSECGL